MAPSTNPWINHIRTIYNANPGMNWCTAMEVASGTYNKQGTATPGKKSTAAPRKTKAPAMKAPAKKAKKPRRSTAK